MRDPRVIEVGNAGGLIAVFMDETEAIAYAETFASYDMFRAELMEAVEKAYPKDDGDEDD